ncbi:galactonate dehydratase [Candidatus Bathyarchaeota archaeon]|nr:MAG: galactonate dehydratase [Candidatus Bathyarchaeota archaeon]
MIKLKIEEIKSFLVHRWLLVRVYTDEGITGNGEAGLWAHHSIVYEAIRNLGKYYIGKDPTRMEHHWQTVSRNTHFMGSVLSAAISAIDIALWDITAKSVNLPVYKLLGGKCREKIKVFANVSGGNLDEIADDAERRVRQGFKSLRVTPFFKGSERQTATETIKTAVEIVKTIREAVGYSVDLGVEIHRNLNPWEAVILARELELYRLLYIEDPIPPESIDGLEYVAQRSRIPIATGERFYNMWQFKELIDRKTVGLIRPDISLAGGFTHCKKIAAIAEASFVGIFPHLMGSPVNTAAQVQLDAAIPNYVLQESNIIKPPLSKIVDEPLRLKDGYVIVPERPGIGVEINEDALKEFPYEPREIKGTFRENGSVAY